MAFGQSSMYEPGLIVALSTQYFNENSNVLYTKLIEYINQSVDGLHPVWTELDFPFGAVSLSNLQITDYKAFLAADKSVTFKVNCGLPASAKPG